jgi:hypothetical protein
MSEVVDVVQGGEREGVALPTLASIRYPPIAALPLAHDIRTEPSRATPSHKFTLHYPPYIILKIYYTQDLVNLITTTILTRPLPQTQL